MTTSVGSGPVSGHKGSYTISFEKAQFEWRRLKFSLGKNQDLCFLCGAGDVIRTYVLKVPDFDDQERFRRTVCQYLQKQYRNKFLPDFTLSERSVSVDAGAGTLSLEVEGSGSTPNGTKAWTYNRGLSHRQGLLMIQGLLSSVEKLAMFEEIKHIVDSVRWKQDC